MGQGREEGQGKEGGTGGRREGRRGRKGNMSPPRSFPKIGDYSWP